jgi:hypothetical protein
VFFPKDEYSYLENLHEYEANPIPTHMAVNQPSLGISKNSRDSWGEMLPLSIPLMKSKVHHLQWKKFSSKELRTQFVPTVTYHLLGERDKETTY